MIQFDNVTKTYLAGTVGLQSVSFTIEDNDFIFLVGPSGAGKTTILKLLMRQLTPTSGSVVVDGTEISSPGFAKIPQLRQSIGMVFQDFKILPDRNVFENVAVTLKIQDVSHNEIVDSVSEALTLVGIADKKLMFPLQLSAGELQRVAIARAIVGDKQIIIGDEPTGNLDPKTSWDIMKIFKQLEGQKTIIIATHNVDIVDSFKKRVLTMQDGKLINDVKKGTYKV